MNKTRPHSNVFKQQYICPVWRMSLLTMGKNIAPLLDFNVKVRVRSRLLSIS
jgi:hypothetical protein